MSKRRQHVKIDMQINLLIKICTILLPLSILTITAVFDIRRFGFYFTSLVMVVSKNWKEDEENVKSLVSDKNENAKNVEQIWRSGVDQTSAAAYMDNLSNNCAQIILLCQPNSHLFQTRKIPLEENVEIKVGRSIARSRASENNGIFDCKVLSRNHAVLWFSDGKFYVKDTKSSNGTFINDRRINQSDPEELNSGDIVKFGVDVIENTRKEIHGCIIACVKLYLPDGREYFSRNSSGGDSGNGIISFEDFNRLQYYLQETVQREKMLEVKLKDIQNILDLSKKNAANCWQAMIDEDKLLNKIDALENKLQFYQKNATEDRLKDEVVKLQEEKFSYQNLAKEALQKVYQDRIESIQKLSVIESELNSSQEECSILREQFANSEKHIEDLNNRLQNMETEYMKYKEQIEIANKENSENSKADSEKNIQLIEKGNECEDYKNYIAELLKERNELRKQLNSQHDGRGERNIDGDDDDVSEKGVSENIIMKWFENSDLKKTTDSDDIIKAICADEPLSQSPQSEECENDIIEESQRSLQHKVDSIESIATTKAEDDDDISLITSIGYEKGNDQVQLENALNLRKDIDAFRETSKELLLRLSTSTSSKSTEIIGKDEDNINHIKELLLKISLMEAKIEKYTDELEKQRTNQNIEINFNNKKEDSTSNEETKLISDQIKATDSKIKDLQNENNSLREEIINLKNKNQASALNEDVLNSSSAATVKSGKDFGNDLIKDIDQEIEEDIETISNLNIRHEEELIIWKEKYEKLIADNRELKQKIEEIKTNTNSLIHNSYFTQFCTVGAALIAVICYLILSKF